MTGFIPILLASAAGFSATMLVAWLVQRTTGKSGWVDTIWTFSVGVFGCLLSLWPFAEPSVRQTLVAVLAGFWAVRLGMHVAVRTAAGGDDPRYARLKQEWGDAAQARMLFFLQLQALAGIVLAFAIFLAAHAPRPGIGLQDVVGALVLLAGVLGETIADRQLKAFAARPNNRGKVCDIGLWRWSRHPNYFFEWIGWFAYPIIAFSADYPLGWMAWIAPAYMYYLLVHVSGIPPLEQHMMRTRPAAFEAYRRRTNAFFPGSPR